MQKLKIHKVVVALPSVLEADSIYLVKTGNGFDLYATNSIGIIVAYKLNASGSATIYQMLSSDYSITIVNDNYFFVVDSTAGEVRLQLPFLSSTDSIQFEVTLINTDLNINNVYIDSATDGTTIQNINGDSLGIILTSPRDSIRIVGYNQNYYIN